MESKSFTYICKGGYQAFIDGRLQSMLCLQVKYRQLQDDLQLYDIVGCGVPSLHIAVSLLDRLTAKYVPSPLSFI